MKTFKTLEGARAQAHPGTFVMKSKRLPVWALMSLDERHRLAGTGWDTVERTRAHHDVIAEAATDWAGDHA